MMLGRTVSSLRASACDGLTGAGRTSQARGAPLRTLSSLQQWHVPGLQLGSSASSARCHASEDGAGTLLTSSARQLHRLAPPSALPRVPAALSRRVRHMSTDAASTAAAADPPILEPDIHTDSASLGKKNGEVPDIPGTTAAGNLRLRPYQEECVQECLQALQAGYTRIGVSSPTGSGKTTIFTALIDRLPPLPRTDLSGPGAAPAGEATQVLILVSSIELALQAARTVTRAYPELHVEIEQGSKYKATGLADVTVATVQTLSRGRSSAATGGGGEERLDKFDPRRFKAVIIDEAHHAAARSYMRVLSHFHPSIGEATPSSSGEDSASVDSAAPAPPTGPMTPILGFSATFSRHDGLALGSVFQRIVFHRDFLSMIHDAWLSPIRFTVLRAKINLAAVRTQSAGSGGDFVTTSLAKQVNTKEINELILRTWLHKCRSPTASAGSDSFRKSTLIFCVNIEHVHALTDTFRQAGIDARALTGETHARDRAQMLDSFKRGEYPVLVNCAILTEGADLPNIDCVLLARPTRSRNLFSQMIGRGMRLSPETGKHNCLVLDLVGNVEKGDGVVCTPTLFGLSADEAIDDASIDALQERQTQAESAAAASAGDAGGGAAAPEEDLLHVSKLSYIDYDDPHELQAVLMRRGRAGIIERMSRNAWVDCGADIYVLNIPKHGYLKVERAEPDQEAAWTAHFTPINYDTAQQEAVRVGGPASIGLWAGMGRRHKSAPYRRPRHVLFSDDLEGAIRGCDTYATTRVLSSSPMNVLLDRRAAWRDKPASEQQRALVERRLGFHAGSGKKGGDRAIAKNGKSVVNEPVPQLLNLTRGTAAMILTRLDHGAKTRWTAEATRQNRIFAAERAEAERREKETVRVGDLPR